MAIPLRSARHFRKTESPAGKRVLHFSEQRLAEPDSIVSGSMWQGGLFVDCVIGCFMSCRRAHKASGTQKYENSTALV